MIVRSACTADAMTLWQWRVDPGTQEFSVYTSEIGLVDHREWVRRCIERRDCYLAVVESLSRVPIGTFRLDHLGTRAPEVSITVAPEWRGHGLATPIIEAAVARAFREPLAERVIAVIHEGNVRSRTAFERAGFRLSAGPAMGPRENKFFVYVRERA